jgi:hypothetical protein
MSINKLDCIAKMYAFEHLGETRDAATEGIREVREFINQDAALNNVVISDAFIMYFLRSNKFRLERVKKKIKR